MTRYARSADNEAKAAKVHTWAMELGRHHCRQHASIGSCQARRCLGLMSLMSLMHDWQSGWEQPGPRRCLPCCIPGPRAYR